jgi:hypothetical protein
LDSFGNVFKKSNMINLNYSALTLCFKKFILSPGDYFFSAKRYSNNIATVINGEWGNIVKHTNIQAVRQKINNLIIQLVKDGAADERHSLGDLRGLGKLVKEIKFKLSPLAIAKRAKCDRDKVMIVIAKMNKK